MIEASRAIAKLKRLLYKSTTNSARSQSDLKSGERSEKTIDSNFIKHFRVTTEGVHSVLNGG